MTTTAESAATAPVVTTGTVVARRPAGAYHLLSLAAPDVVAAAVPGQFVGVEVGARGALLRRPFAIADVDRSAGVLDLVIAVVGRGSAWLAQRPVSTTVELTGPLGTGFAAPDTQTRCLLVGGGYGVAALMWLARQLLDAGHAVELISGARSATTLYPVRPPEALVLHEVTEDGSRGRTGLVTDALVDRLDADLPGNERQRAGGRGAEGEGERQRAGGRGADVFACGPMPMLAAVARVAGARAVPCQVAVEEHMGCSVGVCMTCVVPAGRGYLRACIDGPVIDAARIDWDRVAGGGR